MPEHLVLVRHGQSEANIVQKLFKHDPMTAAPTGFFDRHDSRMRLSPAGRDQARTAGDWLRDAGLATYDRYYVSPHLRAVETAGTLGLDGRWALDVRWRERDWGEFGVVNGAERAERYGLSEQLKVQNPWYWCPPGGESLATGVHGRFRDILDTLHREAAGQRVIAVTHGEMINVARFVLERLTPEEWLRNEEDPACKVRNCQILHYSRRDPVGGNLHTKIRWMRSVCPWDPTGSWNGGQWIEIHRQLYTDADLLAIVDEYPLLLA